MLRSVPRPPAPPPHGRGDPEPSRPEVADGADRGPGARAPAPTGTGAHVALAAPVAGVHRVLLDQREEKEAPEPAASDSPSGSWASYPSGLASSARIASALRWQYVARHSAATEGYRSPTLS